MANGNLQQQLSFIVKYSYLTKYHTLLADWEKFKNNKNRWDLFEQFKKNVIDFCPFVFVAILISVSHIYWWLMICDGHN
jgi:hypothetical protein